MMSYIWDDAVALRLRELSRRAATQPQIAEKTGISLPTLQRILAGRSNPGIDRLRAICDAIGVTPEQVMYQAEAPSRHDGKPSDEAHVPVYEIEVAAGAGRTTFDEVEPVDHWPFTKAFLGQFGSRAELKLVRVAGDSQEPDLSDGDMVMIDTAANRLGDGMHVVRLADLLMLKRVQVRGVVVLLKSANPAYDDIEVDLTADHDQFAVIGRAVWAGKML